MAGAPPGLCQDIVALQRVVSEATGEPGHEERHNN